MRIFKFKMAGDVECFLSAGSDDHQVITSFLRGASRNELPDAVRVMQMRADSSGRLQKADVVWGQTSKHIALRRSTIELLGAVVPADSAWLDLESGGDVLHLWRPPLVEGAVDWERSDLLRLSTGTVLAVRDPVFRAESLDGRTAFRVEQPKFSDLFVTDRFVEVWNEIGLTGVLFSEVWSND